MSPRGDIDINGINTPNSACNYTIRGLAQCVRVSRTVQELAPNTDTEYTRSLFGS